MSENTVGTGTLKDDALTPPEEMNYEQARNELVETVRILELGQMSLDESLAYWERGEALAKRCEDLLAGAAKKVESVVGKQED
ncbi:exodeoxyribonuclease VII small subunit [Corynebacterium tapiri]|uniref:Exodeoxyribonuclease 7 small subunit n=1 Tax=Corynebacterium tapiri TaxID=1448266 RepID=A0A5C4U7X6_9CORY|nr:exodeoxyribonuclease VII small subunit [Corynebacterium tapiri]TNM00510.1 exodeoxyribonuclease VII small subunit [Corynebacterium tapiri]